MEELCGRCYNHHHTGHKWSQAIQSPGASMSDYALSQTKVGCVVVNDHGTTLHPQRKERMAHLKERKKNSLQYRIEKFASEINECSTQ
jgi:hypothetical protein